MTHMEMILGGLLLITIIGVIIQARMHHKEFWALFERLQKAHASVDELGEKNVRQMETISRLKSEVRTAEKKAPISQAALYFEPLTKDDLLEFYKEQLNATQSLLKRGFINGVDVTTDSEELKIVVSLIKQPSLKGLKGEEPSSYRDHRTSESRPSTRVGYSASPTRSSPVLHDDGSTNLILGLAVGAAIGSSNHSHSHASEPAPAPVCEPTPSYSPSPSYDSPAPSFDGGSGGGGFE